MDYGSDSNDVSEEDPFEDNSHYIYSTEEMRAYETGLRSPAFSDGHASKICISNKAVKRKCPEDESPKIGSNVDCEEIEKTPLKRKKYSMLEIMKNDKREGNWEKFNRFKEKRNALRPKTTTQRESKVKETNRKLENSHVRKNETKSPGRPKKLLEKRRSGRPKKLPKGEGLPERHEMLLVKKFPGRPKKVTKKNPGRPKKLPEKRRLGRPKKLPEGKGLPERHEMLLVKKFPGRPKKVTKKNPGRPKKLPEKRRLGRPKKLPYGKGLPERHEMLLVKKFPGRPEKVTKKNPGRPKKLPEKRRLGRPKKLPEGKGLPERHEMLLVKKFPGRPKKVTKKNPGRPKKLPEKRRLGRPKKLPEGKGLPERHEMLLVKKFPGRPKKVTKKNPGRPKKLPEKRRLGRPKKLPEGKGLPERHEMLLVKKFPGRPKKVTKKNPGRPKKLPEKRRLGRPKKLPEGKGLPERHEMLLVKKFPGRPKKVTKKSPGRPKKLPEKRRLGRPKKLPKGKGLPERHEMLLVKKFPIMPKKVTKKNPGRPKKLPEKRRLGRPKKLPEGKGLPERHEMLLVKKCRGRPKKITKKSPGRPKKLLEKRRPGRPKKLPEGKGLQERHEMLLVKKFPIMPKKATKKSPGRPKKSPISEIEKNYGWTESKETKGRAKISTSLEINKDKSKGLSGETKKSTEKQGPNSVFEISEPENIKCSRGRPRINKLSKVERPKRFYNKGGSKILDNNSKPVLYKSISSEGIPFVSETSVLEKEKGLANLPEEGDMPKRANDNVSSDNIKMDKGIEMDINNAKSPGKSSPKVKESINNEEGSPEINTEIETNSERLEESTTSVNENYGNGEKNQDFPVLKANHEDRETLHTDQCVTSTQAVSHITVHSKKNQTTKSYPTLGEDSEGKCIEEEHSSTSVRKGKGTRTFSKETQFESRKRKKEETFSPSPGPSSVGSFEDKNSLPKKRSRKFVLKLPFCGEDCDLILKNFLGEVPHSPVDSYFIDSDLENLCSPNENNLPEEGDIPKKAKDNASSDNIEIDKDIEMNVENDKSPGKSSPKVKESFNNEEGSPEIDTEIETNTERLEESTTSVNENYGNGEKKQDFPVLKANHEGRETLHTDQCVTSTQAVSHITVHSKKNQATKSYPTLEEDSEGNCIEEEHSSTSVRKGKGTRTFSKETQFESRKRKKEETFSPCPGPSSVGSFEDKNSLPKKRSRKFVLKLPFCGEDCDLILKNFLGEVPHSPVDSYFIDSDLENLCSPNENNLPEEGDIPKKAKDNASSDNIEIDKDIEMNVENDKSPGKSSPKVKESFNNEEGSPEIDTEIETITERLEESTTSVNENYGNGEKKQDFPVLKANHEGRETLHTDQCVTSTQAVSHITVHSKKNQATKSYPTLEEDSEGNCIEEEHSSTSVRKGKGTRTFSKETQFESRKRKKEETVSPCPEPSSVGSFEDENSLPKKRSRKFVFKFPTCREDFDFDLVLKKFLGEVPQSPIESYFIDCDLENHCSPNENNLPEEGDIPKKAKDNASSDNIEIDKDIEMNVENDKSPGKSSPKVKESFNNEEGSPEIDTEIETNTERLEESTTSVNENYGNGEKKQDFPVLKANHEDKETLHTDQCVTSTEKMQPVKKIRTVDIEDSDDDPESNILPEVKYPSIVGSLDPTHIALRKWEKLLLAERSQFYKKPDPPHPEIDPIKAVDTTGISAMFQRCPKESFFDLDGDEYHILSEEEEDQVEKLPSTSKRRRIGRKCGVSLARKSSFKGKNFKEKKNS